MKPEYYVGGDPAARQRAMAKAALRRELESRQNVVLALAGGLIGAAVGAVLWAIVTVVTGIQIGFMALGVGLLAGYGVWILGRGLSPMYGAIGGVLAAAGCVGGNVLTVYIYAARALEVSVFEVFGMIDSETFAECMRSTFHPLDIVFYILAISAGFKYSFHKLAI
jgi:hypothetical protein